MILEYKIEPIKAFKITRPGFEVYREFMAQQHAILMDFLISGAMLRDLALEKGPIEWVEVAPMILQPQQQFMVV